MTEEEFTCANCKGVFEKARSDEEAMKETEENFPDEMDEPMEVVCDDCFKKMETYFGWNQV